MIEPPRQAAVLRFEWWRFAILACVVVVPFGALALLTSNGMTTSVALALFGVSLVTLFAYRWWRLRIEVAMGRLTPEEFHRDPRAHVRGPWVPLVVWFVATLATIVGIVVLGATGA